jgi:flagellar biosynthesis protein FlhB
MWIELKLKDVKAIINTVHVECIKLENDRVDIYSVSMKGSSPVIFSIVMDDKFKALAMYEGLKIALNGMDFTYGEYDYIKPLFSDKNKSLYEYMKMKEMEGDRT